MTVFTYDKGRMATSSERLKSKATASIAGLYIDLCS